MINIMFAGNYKVFDGMLIASLSIVKHCKEPIHAYILTMDKTDVNPSYIAINKEQIGTLQNIYSNAYNLSIVEKVDLTNLYDKFLHNTKNSKTLYTPYALLRLLSDKVEILPEKILYLDTDVVANKDISELYNIDISNYEIAMAKDYYGKVFINRNYCNSGVVLMNLAKIRQTHMLENALNFCINRHSFLPDQTALHKASKYKLILPDKYNEQHKLKNETVIRHFSMTLRFFPWFKRQNIKPWNIDALHKTLKCFEFDDILNEYLKIKAKLENKGDTNE